MLKGAKKAIVRVPHRLGGSKSIEDKVIIEWTKDFVTADEALAQIVRETKAYTESWRDICKGQEEIALTFRELYEPIREENMYRSVQETPESALTAVAQYREFVGGRGSSHDGKHGHSINGGLLEAIDPYISYLEGPFTNKVNQARDCLKEVQKLLTKREHKKVDFDRHSNGLQKLLKKRHGGEALSEKEQVALTKQEQDLEQATEVFQELDERVKTTVPYVLTYMSEFLNPITASLYLTQLKIFEQAQRLLARYALDQGLAGTLTSVGGSTEYPPTTDWSLNAVEGEPVSYISIMDGWEERFTTIQPRCEQGLTTLRDGDTVKTPIGESRHSRREIAAKSVQKVTVKTFSKGYELTSGLAHKAVGKRPNKYVENITFSSPEKGFFRTEADLLQIAAVMGPNIPGDSVISSGSDGSDSGRAASPNGSAAGSAGGLGGFSFFRRASGTSTSNQPVLSRSSSSSQSRVPSFGASSGGGSKLPRDHHFGTFGRSPVTSSLISSTTPEADKASREALKTRVRASMSTTAWALHESPSTIDSISNRLRGSSISSHSEKAGPPPYPSNGASSLQPSDGFSKPQRYLAPENEKAVALYTFGGEAAGDVAFRVGEEISVLDHGDETDDQWWFGKTKDGRVGLFPQSYVRVL